MTGEHDSSIEPLVETDELTAMREDHARLRAAFVESVLEERGLRARLASQVALLEARNVAVQRLSEEVAAVRDDLDRVLRSPTWKVGSAATAVPRWLRDRRRR